MKRLTFLASLLLLAPLCIGGNIAGLLGGKPSGPNTYYYSQAQGSGTPGNWYVGLGYYYWGVITVSQSGTCTSVGAYQSASGTDNTKFALYNGAGTRVATSGVVAATGVGWKDGAVSVAVTAGTYRVAFAVETGGLVAWEQDTAGTNNDGGRDSEVYVAGFPSTIQASNVGSGGMLTVRMYVQ